MAWWQKAGVEVLYAAMRCWGCLPLPVLFFISDVVIYPLVYGVFRYRRGVVRANLEGCFPEASMGELRAMERRFYRHFCDTFQETLRLTVMSRKEAFRRVRCANPEWVIQMAKEHGGVLLMLGHYGNWEWASLMNLYLIQDATVSGFNVYRPLKNVLFDQVMQRIRGRFGNINVSKNDTYRAIVRLKRASQSGIFGLISDQSPSKNNLSYWTPFLHRDTAMLEGAERMGKQTHFPVVYADVRKTGRGYYAFEFKLVAEFPAETPTHAITECYARWMEETILREPAYWLWTHKRWKHARTHEAVSSPKTERK